jgi:hypothetical protein
VGLVAPTHHHLHQPLLLLLHHHRNHRHHAFSLRITGTSRRPFNTETERVQRRAARDHRPRLWVRSRVPAPACRRQGQSTRRRVRVRQHEQPRAGGWRCGACCAACCSVPVTTAVAVAVAIAVGVAASRAQVFSSAGVPLRCFGSIGFGVGPELQRPTALDISPTSDEVFVVDGCVL